VCFRVPSGREGCFQQPGSSRPPTRPRRLRRVSSSEIRVLPVEAPCREPPRRRTSPPGHRPHGCPLGPPETVRRAPRGTRRPPRPPSRSPTHATRTKPMKVAARWPLLPPVARFLLVSHTPPHGPFTGLIPVLANRCSGPSCTSRRLSRRHHLRLRQGLAGRDRTPLLGISKDRLSVVRCWRVHSRGGIAADTSERTEPPFVHVPSPRSCTALTASSSPTLHVCCNVLPTMRSVVF